MLKIHPVTLTGRVVRLEGLSRIHVPELTEAGQDENIWKHMVYGTIHTQSQMLKLVEELIQRQEKGTDVPFVVIHLLTNQAIGMTRYMDIRPQDRALEIGGTWYAPSYQRTAVNTESKLLLLTHAFEVIGCIRVQFKTDSRNIPSQRALERIGAEREGVLRSHMILPDGYIRDSVYYSIIASEWPQVKANLNNRLQAYMTTDR
jgi:RimJ/RimL family protein N-acetyltransferase